MKLYLFVLVCYASLSESGPSESLWSRLQSHADINPTALAKNIEDKALASFKAELLKSGFSGDDLAGKGSGELQQLLATKASTLNGVEKDALEKIGQSYADSLSHAQKVAQSVPMFKNAGTFYDDIERATKEKLVKAIGGESAEEVDRLQKLKFSELQQEAEKVLKTKGTSDGTKQAIQLAKVDYDSGIKSITKYFKSEYNLKLLQIIEKDFPLLNKQINGLHPSEKIAQLQKLSTGKFSGELASEIAKFKVAQADLGKVLNSAIKGAAGEEGAVASRLTSQISRTSSKFNAPSRLGQVGGKWGVLLAAGAGVGLFGTGYAIGSVGNQDLSNPQILGNGQLVGEQQKSQ